LFFILILTGNLVVYASPQDVTPEDAAVPGSLPALYWNDTGVNVEDWIESFINYLNQDDQLYGLNNEDFRLRACFNDSDVFRSVQLSHLEIFLGIRNEEIPLLIGVTIYPLPELSKIPAQQLDTVFTDYKLVMNASIYANTHILKHTSINEADETLGGLQLINLAEIVALAKDTQISFTVPSSQGVSTQYFFRYEADHMFLTFGFDFFSETREPILSH